MVQLGLKLDLNTAKRLLGSEQELQHSSILQDIILQPDAVTAEIWNGSVGQKW